MKLSVNPIRALTALAVAALVADASASPSTALAGTTWSGSDSTGESNTYNFAPDGTLTYAGSNGTRGEGTWKQQGDVVTFEVNNSFATYRGRIQGDSIDGTASNKNDFSWTWKVSRRPAAAAEPRTLAEANTRIHQLEAEAADLKRQLADPRTRMPPSVASPAAGANNATADELYAAYVSNTLVANEKYKNRQLTVTGEVYQVGEEGVAPTLPYAELSGDGVANAIWCFFGIEDRERVIRLPRGAKITLTGTVKGRQNGRLEVVDCRLR